MIIPRIPNPRTLKRIKVLEKHVNVILIYWDRDLPVKEEFDINPINVVHGIKVKAPEGKPLKRILPLLVFWKVVYKQLRIQGPLILHVENLDMLILACLYKKFSNKQVKIIYEVADLPKYSFRVSGRFKNIVFSCFRKFEQKIISSISNIILTSPYFWEVYYSDFVDESKYLFLPNAPSKKLFASYEKQKNEIFTIGFIGSVRYVKQLKMLIDAVGEMDKNIKVFIAGSGPGYQVIAEYIKDKPWVEMHGPYNYEQEIVSLYEKVDCVYSVYDTELENVKVALPNRLYEAIVCELPIIAAKGTALGKFIEEKEIGATVGANDKEGLKSILTKWVSDENLIQQYSFSCKLIKEDYYYENNSDKLLELYRNLA